MSVAAMVCLATGIYAASMVPFLLLVDADHLTPTCMRRLSRGCTKSLVRDLIPACVRRLPLSVAALLLILGGPDVR